MVVGSGSQWPESNIGSTADFGLINRQPDNNNTLQQNKFKFIIQRFPNLEFRVKNVILPGTSIRKIERTTAFNSIYYPGGEYDQDELTVRFLVDEELNNYFEIWNWMMALAPYKDFDYVVKNYSDYTTNVSMIFLSNKLNPLVEITFEDIWPVSISEIDMSYDDTDTTPIEATVSFSFNTMKVRRIK